MRVIPATQWLYPEQQASVVERLLELGLLKFDNGRSLPLKKGGSTDVYINLRDARDNSEAIRFVSDLYVHPFRYMGIDRLVEVPDSVSCFAPLICQALNLPYLTIRSEEKAGRVSDAKMIGHPNKRESVGILDDVITDGASKVGPYRLCQSLDLICRALVVLVDRQQGWREKFANESITVPVWAGMTLHDVRRHLVQTLGVMKRCAKETEEKNPIIVALDGKSWDEILPIIDQLRTTGCILKVNDLLLDQGISNLLPNLSVYGRVMVDIKEHDIPNTVGNITRWVKPHKPWAVTVHASGGKAMVEAAVKVLEGTPTKVLAVTVLTSIDSTTCDEIYQRTPLEQVLKLAAIAKAAGAHGFVCSPEEAKVLRQEYPDATIVTPGVRSYGAEVGDQQRINTPAVAIANGASNVVMGRQLLGAEDPVREVKRVLKDELRIVI